jgi:hypothetical protein
VPHHFIHRGQYDRDDPGQLVGSLVAQLEEPFPTLREPEAGAPASSFLWTTIIPVPSQVRTFMLWPRLPTNTNDRGRDGPSSETRAAPTAIIRTAPATAARRASGLGPGRPVAHCQAACPTGLSAT